MAINRKIAIICIAVIIYTTTVFSTCNKPAICSGSSIYSFQMDIITYPNNETFFIGDTIWFEINGPSMLRDNATGAIIDYSGAQNLGSNIYFLQEVGVNQTPNNAAAKFLFQLLKGREVSNANPDLYREYLFQESNNRYAFKLGVIPKERGIFRIGFGNAANVYTKNDRCTKAGFSFSFSDTIRHHYYLAPYLQGDSLQPSGAYFFKVK